MLCITILVFLGCTTIGSANLNGPYLFWGHQKVLNLQPRALVEAGEQDFANLYKSAKAIVIFVRNNTHRLDGLKYPKFQELIQHNAWSYLPQHTLAVEPFNYNANIEVINLIGYDEEEDASLVAGFNESLAIYGEGEVLGILANREYESHYLSKREATAEENKETTTTQTPITDNTDEKFIFLQEKKAILYLNAAPILNIADTNETLKLMSYNKETQFNIYPNSPHARLSVGFFVDGLKLSLRFKFTLVRGTWSMNSVHLNFKSYDVDLPIEGGPYDIPSAPLGFSYRCSARPMIFTNKNITLIVHDYQMQPYLKDDKGFGDVYDCVGFTTAPILAGVMVSFLLCGVLAIGIIALMDIKTPNRFESSRSKQLTFTIQE